MRAMNTIIQLLFMNLTQSHPYKKNSEVQTTNYNETHMTTNSRYTNLLVYFHHRPKEERLLTLCLTGCVGQQELTGDAPFQLQMCNCLGF